MNKIIAVIAIISTIGIIKANAQGCVAIRSTGGAACSMQKSTDSSKWTLAINGRYFKSFRHFVGTAEQKQRVDQGTQVINHSLTADLSYYIGIKWLLSFYKKTFCVFKFLLPHESP